MSESTPKPWAISDARTVEGHAMVVGGDGPSFGLVAEVVVNADAVEIIDAVNFYAALVAERDALKARVASLKNALNEVAFATRQIASRESNP